MKKLFVSVLALAGLVACNTDYVIDEVNNSQAITFGGVSVDNATRSNPSTTTNNIEAFSVWAYMKDVDGYVFNDELVTRSGDAWTYVNTQYWLPGNTYHFAAFAGDRSKDPDGVPQVQGLPYAMGANGLGTVTFTNVDGTNDILYAEDVVEAGETYTQPVDLDFAHLLSKVKFTFKNGFANNNNTIVVENIKMKAPKSASVDLSSDDLTWSDWSEDTVELAFGNMNGANKLEILKSASSDDERFTIPAPAAQEYVITFNVTLYNGAQVGIDARPMTVVLNGFEFEAGRAYNLVATINQENLNLNAIEFEVEVDEWVEAGDVEGDYYYDAASNTYDILTAEGLALVAEKFNNGEIPTNANIALMNDIDFAQTRSAESNWTPIGLSSDLANGKTFTGTFDGRGHTIKNLVCERADVVGLFGYVYAATIKNVTIENATFRSNHFAGGIVAWVNNFAGNTKQPFVLENCHVVNSTISSTPELVNGAYDNGDKVGGLIGAAWISRSAAINAGTKIANCSVRNTTVKAYRDLGGLFGLAEGLCAENCVLENVAVEQDLTNGYKDEVPTTVGDFIGRDGGNNVINGLKLVGTAEALAAALTANDENIAIALTADIDLPINTLGQQTGGSGEYKLGGEATETINIDLNGKKLNITTTYWSALGAKNENALFTIKNGTMTSSQATGTWNSYDLCFANCNYAFENVVFEKAIALEGKAYNLKNVKITETHDYYSIWISAKGQNVTIDGLTIESAGRGIKIDEQYVSAPAKVTLNVANATFKTAKKAAIVVKSVAGAEIIWGAGNDIANVAADNVFAVWVDEDSAAYADKVVVKGAPSKVEGATSVLVYTAEELNNLKATNAYVVLMADIDFGGAAMTKPIELWKDSTFDGNGHKISNVTTGVQGGYATSLFRGDANPGNKVVKNLVIENLSTPAGYSYAAAIWSDLQGANIEIDNVHINNSKIQAKGTIGGFVGFVSGSTTSVVVKNSTISNTALNGGEADHKRGAVVGRAYGCVVNCENVVVENVEINDVAATEATLVGDKGYTGTVTVK